MNIKKKLFIRLFLFLSWFFLFFYSFLTTDLRSTKINDWNIVFVLDVSNSMNVKDVFYNNHQVSRLELAKQIIANNVENKDLKFGLIVFSNKFKYFIPPTLDKNNFLIYLNTINTNLLNGWKTNFIKSLNWLNKVLNPTDVLVVLSDFDTKENLKKIDIKNYTYAIEIWTKSWWIVRNKEWISIYKKWWFVKSSVWRNINFWNKIYKITSYKEWEILPFLKQFKNKNLIKDREKNNIFEILWFLFIIFSF